MGWIRSIFFNDASHRKELKNSNIFENNITLAGGLEMKKIAQWDGLLTGVNSNNEIPAEFKLNQNYPNLFNPMTNVKFQILKSGFVRLKIFDARGKEVSTLLSNSIMPGPMK